MNAIEAVERLQQFIDGEIELSDAEVRELQGIVDEVVPDLPDVDLEDG